MAVVHCPDCRTALEVAEHLLGDPVACGACGTVFDPQGTPPRRARPVAREPDDEEYEERPRRRRRRFEDDEDDYEPVRPSARLAYLPGLLSAVACCIGMLYRIADAALVWANPGFLQNNPLMMGGKAPPVEVYVGFAAFAVVWQCVVLAASFRMMSGRNYQLCLVGMAMGLLPCGGPCCVLELPVAIWGLIVLNRPEVRAGFEQGSRDDFDD